MAKPMRRSGEVLGGEPWTRRTWCRDISPGSRVRVTALLSSTSTATSWPRVRRLCLAKVSRCGTWSSVCEPRMTRIAPFPSLAAVKATQAVTTSGRLRPQYVESWCQETNASFCRSYEEVGRPAQEVGAVEILDGVED